MFGSRVETEEASRTRRVLAYAWSHAVVFATAGLPDFAAVMRLRGALLRPCFARCGKNVQVASGVKLSYTTSIDVGDDVLLASGSWVLGYGGVTLGDGVMLGPYSVVASSDHTKVDGSWRFGKPTQRKVSIGRGAWVGAHSVVTAGVSIGEGALVAAGAVVTKDVAAHDAVGGVPARPLKKERS